MEKVEVSTATEILEENEDKEAIREVVTTNPIATETKDKEAAEANDNDVEKVEKVEVSTDATEILEDKDADVEKVEKVEIIGGFSTSGVSTEILEESKDKVNETFNIFDPTGMEEGGNNKVVMTDREKRRREKMMMEKVTVVLTKSETKEAVEGTGLT